MRRRVFDPETFSSGIRRIYIGGMGKRELVQALREHRIRLNESAETLLAHDRFATSATRRIVETIELAVADLDFPQGATSAQIFTAAIARGFSLCPLELGPHFRLQYLDQREGFRGHAQTQHQAPPGSITIASAPLADDDDFPKGFYVRRIQGELGLRGYHADTEHVWNPNDHLLFCDAVESQTTR